MRIRVFYFLALFFASLALGPAMAHLLELPNKINLSRADSVGAQRVATICFQPHRIPVHCGTQIVFWTYTFPTNRVTNNWTILPDNWEHPTGAAPIELFQTSVILSLCSNVILSVAGRRRRHVRDGSHSDDTSLLYARYRGCDLFP